MDDSWTIKSLLDGMLARGEHPAVIAVHGEAAEVWSCARVADHALRLAHGLLDAGLEQAEPVVIIGPNSPSWLVAALAIDAAGGVTVPVDAGASAAEVAGIFRDSGSTRAFVTAERLSEFVDRGDGTPVNVFVLDDEGEAGHPRSWRTPMADAEGDLPTLEPDANASLFYTSGTTAAPKAFHLSYANIAANVTALSNLGILRTTDRALLPLPFHHAYPWIVGTLTTLSCGVPLVLPESPSGPHIRTAMQVGRPTMIIGVPRLYEALLANIEVGLASRGGVGAAFIATLWRVSIWCRRRMDWRAGRTLMRPVRARIGPGVRLLVSGGAHLKTQAVWKLEGLGWEVLSGYGLAETSSMFTGNLPWERRVGSEGKPVAGGEIRIADADDSDIGEIQLKGPNVFAGYTRAEVNRDVFTEDGWFRTGDLGYLDSDGFLFVTGRAKELIVLGSGKNIFPEDVERAYAAHPHVAELAVLEHQGSLVALVVPDMAAIQAAGMLRVQDAMKVALTSVAQQLPSFQRLAGFAIAREPLPKTQLGKFRRFLLPSLYERTRAGAARPTPTEISKKDQAFLAASPARDVWQILIKRFPDQPLTLETSPQLDLGVGSFEWMMLALDLERSLGVRLTEDQIARVETLRDLVNEVMAGGEQPANGEPGAEQWLRPTNALHRLLGYLLFAFNKLLMWSVFRLRVTGVDRIPRQGPFVVAPNHASDLDPLIMAAALPFRTMRQAYWGADVVRVFAGPVRRFLCRVLHIFPVDERRPMAAIETAKRVLADGNVQMWFPEGWRSPDGKLLRFQPGIGKLLRESGAPVVPAYISGTFEAWPRHHRWPRPHPVRVVFGDPIDVGTLLTTEAAGDDDEKRAAALRDRVAELGRAVGASPTGDQES